MALHWHYYQHDPSGDFYAISVGDNGMFGDICGPLRQDERTIQNLTEANFHEDADGQGWMREQTWRKVGPDNPHCECPAVKLMSRELLRALALMLEEHTLLIKLAKTQKHLQQKVEELFEDEYADYERLSTLMNGYHRR